MCLNLYPYVEYQRLEGQGCPRAESTAPAALGPGRGRPTCLERLRQASPSAFPALALRGEVAPPWPSCPLPSLLCSFHPIPVMVPQPYHDFHPQAWMGHRSRQGGSARSLGRPESCSSVSGFPAPPRGEEMPPSCGLEQEGAVQLSRCLGPEGSAGRSPDRLEPLRRPLG